MIEKEVEKQLRQAIDVKMMLLQVASDTICEITKMLLKVCRKGGVIYLIGNGGSAADAQHFAAELVGRFNNKNRKPIKAVALTTNTSSLSAIANDFGFENIFSRQVDAFVSDKDALIVMSTSGLSRNIVEAAKHARKKNAKVIALTGDSGNELKSYSDICLEVPSKSIARIQECHQTIGHIICSILEQELSKSD